MKKTYIYNKVYVLALLLVVLAVWGCSSTSALPEGEQLYTGLKKIEYTNYEKNDHATATQEELNYVLATAPNGALFGSSFYRNPFPINLWIWNAFVNNDDAFSRWMVKAFGSAPKLLSQVNPALRASVAQSQLKNYGYFHGRVGYETLLSKDQKTGKISYTVNMGPLFRYDSVDYVNFPATADSLMAAHQSEALVKRGEPFSVSSLDQERRRLSALFRNNGYYYYKTSYASYLADTINHPGAVRIRLQMADSLDDRVSRKRYIGKMNLNFRREFTDKLRDSLVFRSITSRFNGRKPPLRPGVVLRALKLRPKQLYNADNETQSNRNLQSSGLFNYYQINFTPREDDTDTLDMEVNMVFDRPYDFYVEADAKGKTSDRMGPELTVGLTKRNAFRGAEKLDINLHGSYEWQTGHHSEGSGNGVNSYEYGADVALTMPRLLTPRSLFRRTWKGNSPQQRPRKRRRVLNPTTTIKASFNVLNRASYFKRHVVSGELTYDFWTSAQSHHSFSPLILSYEYMHSRTAAFDSLLEESPYLKVSMQDQFVPKMSYSYQYQSPAGLANPITWGFTVSEAGNVVSLAYLPFGKKWSEEGKKLFKNPYAQFVKLEADFVKKWSVGERSAVLGHVNAGMIWSYGNAETAPYYEQFYVGGANSVRAFNVRAIGPGKYVARNRRMSYVEQTGDIKLLANLEYRPHLAGDLYGALFLDAGNVWNRKDDPNRPDSKFSFSDFYKQLALGTGIGLRYDMGLFVIRLDWGIGLHLPYGTDKSGFYNLPSFKDSQTLNIAIGYPF